MASNGPVSFYRFTKCKKGVTYGENPLQGKRHAPSPLVVALIVTIGGGSDNDRTNRPTHLQSSSAGTSESKGNNLACVGGRVGNEDAPRDTLQGLSDGEEGERVGLDSEMWLGR